MGSEILGAVTSRKGIRRTKVNADRTARSGFGSSVEVSVLFGEAEKNIRGRMRSTAVATDERDSILKEWDLPVFVVMGCDPLRAVYSGRV